MGITQEMWKLASPIDFGNELTASEEAKAWKTIWSAGHGVAKITDNPSISELVSRLKREFKSAIENQYKLLEQYGL
ncbi:MAG: hypothetical protein HQ474_03190 [Flammeovirgaceae bacterium]|jgi:nitronate monooxygenase|nr:hypothetical protein [Flammeovirgaceae bacterium]|tara:strand:- start:30174 stop:30401 length:228 start_codon:yes stop_codon:yes gene_type:complete